MMRIAHVYRFDVVVTIEGNEGDPALTIAQVQEMIEVALDEHADLHAVVESLGEREESGG